MSSKSSIQAFFSRLRDSFSQSESASGISRKLDSPKSPEHPHSNNGGSQTDPNRPLKSPKPIYQRWWIWILLGVGASTVGTVVTVRRSLEVVEQGLPDVSAVLTFVRDGTLTLEAQDGTILQQIGPATRDKVQFEQIPPLFTDAFIAAEDKKFYDHNGVDHSAIARAVYRNISAGELVEGGSTITQQLARIVFLDQARTFERKLREAMLAQKIERELSKDTILERYLNLVYLGSGAYGIADAAWIYFSKSVDELSLSEIAMIAGLAPAPSVYSPLVDLDAARQRRDLTLERMADSGFITLDEKNAAIAAPIELNPSLPRYFLSDTPYFTSYIQQQLTRLVSPEDLELGGLTIETTLNLEWQKRADETVRKAIAEYGPRQGFKQAALVALDPRTGAIQAMVGGDDFDESQFNRVTQAQRQPGSTFKTFVYATGIAGGFSPYKTYKDAKFVVDGYEPENYGERYRGSVSIRDALISSMNVVAVKALIDIGFDPVIEVAQKMGIQSELYPTYSLALGASEVNLLELTGAYGTLANQGEHVEPHGIVRILNRYDEVIYEANAVPERAIDADVAAIMTWMLQGVVDSGTGRRARLGRSVAGKTGTSEERRDLWFVGYIPQVVTGVWLGNDDNEPTWGVSGTAAQTWRDFMAHVVQDMPVEEFPDLPRLDGREATLELQPVKPKRMSDRPNGESDDDNRSRSEPSDNDSDATQDSEDRIRRDRESTDSGNRNRGDEAESSPRTRDTPNRDGNSESGGDAPPESPEPVQESSPSPEPSQPAAPAAEEPAPPAVPAIPVTEPVAPVPSSSEESDSPE